MLLMGMNCDDEKMVVLSSSTSTTNEWPQSNNNNNNNNINHMISDDHHQKTLMFNPSSTNKNMASSSTTTTDQQQQALKCPRCDSSNTKFCYYNNYSLSQPRHFCKACKRYWTRGGTLRNVPVGGGCRKNKRLKRPSSSAAASSALDAIIAPPNSHIDLSSSSASNHHHHQSSTGHIGSLLYAHHDMISLPFSRYDAMSAVQPQLSALGLDSDSYQNGLIGNNDNNNSILSSYGSIFGGASSTPTIASLLASKFASNNSKEGLGSFQALPSFEELNEAGMMSVNSGSNNKHVKLELDGNGRSLAWINAAAAGACNNSATSCYDHQNNNNNNHTDQIVLSSAISSDPSLYWTNPTAVVVGGGNWLDPTANIGSNSVPSLI